MYTNQNADSNTSETFIGGFIATWLITALIVVGVVGIYGTSKSKEEDRVEKVTAHLIKNDCWAIDYVNQYKVTGLNNRVSGKQVAYYCKKHPENPVFSEIYVGSRNAFRVDSKFTVAEKQKLHAEMTENGTKYEYIVPPEIDFKEQSTSKNPKIPKGLPIQM